MKKRILTIGLSLVLGVSFLAACTNNDDTDTSTSDSTSSSQEEETEEPTTDATTEATTVDETTEETTAEETEETTVEDTEETTTEQEEQPEGTWETDGEGRIILPELETAEFNVLREAYAPGAESEEAALARLEDFTLEFTDAGGLVINNSDQSIFNAVFEISINGGEETIELPYYSSVNAGDSFPSLITTELLGTELEAIDPETTEITGIIIRINTGDGYQEIYENYQGSEGVSTADFEPYGVIDVEQVAVQADELDFAIEVNGETLSVTVTNNSQYPLSTIGFGLDAPDLPVQFRNINPEFTIGMGDGSDVPVYPGESVTKEFTIDEAVIVLEGATIAEATDSVPALADLDAQNWSVTSYLVFVGTADYLESAAVSYDYALGNYSQVNIFDGE